MELLYFLIACVLVVVPLWRIVGRTGFHPALSLVAVVPGLGFLIVLAVLAFAEWPAAKSGTPKLN